MKQFNLEEYLKDPNRKIVTRDGRNVRIICADFDNPDFPVVCEIEGHKWPLSFMTNGTSIKGRQLCSDLFFAPEKREGWINLYYSGVERTTDGDIVYGTEQDAKRNVHDYPNYIGTIKIEWEE